jgi:hypothetical protein
VRNAVTCFLLTPTDRYQVRLRRYTRDDGRRCPGRAGCCNASVVLGVEQHASAPTCGDRPDVAPHDDPRWPTTCEACGRVFELGDAWQVRYERMHARSDGGPETTLRDAPPGAMWDAPWMVPHVQGPDGRCLIVRLPDGHDWTIDDEANNCTRKGDRTHQCWCRHGEPPVLTVDKRGESCAAGAGSIQTPRWHGFLRNGRLEPC